MWGPVEQKEGVKKAQYAGLHPSAKKNAFEKKRNLTNPNPNSTRTTHNKPEQPKKKGVRGIKQPGEKKRAGWLNIENDGNLLRFLGYNFLEVSKIFLEGFAQKLFVAM